MFGAGHIAEGLCIPKRAAVEHCSYLEFGTWDIQKVFAAYFLDKLGSDWEAQRGFGWNRSCILKALLSASPQQHNVPPAFGQGMHGVRLHKFALRESSCSGLLANSTSACSLLSLYCLMAWPGQACIYCLHATVSDCTRACSCIIPLKPRHWVRASSSNAGSQGLWPFCHQHFIRILVNPRLHRCVRNARGSRVSWWLKG